jgi:hypothetical protein
MAILPDDIGSQYGSPAETRDLVDGRTRRDQNARSSSTVIECGAAV